MTFMHRNGVKGEVSLCGETLLPSPSLAWLGCVYHISATPRHSDGGLGVTGCVPPVWHLYFGTLLHSLSDLMQQKGRLMHAYLEKAYNFGFSRGRTSVPPPTADLAP